MPIKKLSIKTKYEHKETRDIRDKNHFQSL